jgi:hypothetical protein
VLGVRGEMDIEEIEENRVRRSYTFYKLLPDSIKRLVTGNFLDQYETGQFYIDHEEVGESMDLFAIAEKSDPH